MNMSTSQSQALDASFRKFNVAADAYNQKLREEFKNLPGLKSTELTRAKALMMKKEIAGWVACV